MRIAYSLAALVAALGLAFPAQAQDKSQSQEKSQSQAEQKRGDKQGGVAREDRRSMERLAQSDMAEIAAGKLAAEKAQNPEVKKYGEHMVQEHTKMLEEGGKLAKAKGMEPPKDTDKKHKAALDKLAGLSGEEFDRQFIRQMVRDHEEALKLAERTAKEAKDPDVKAHAQKGAPHIKQHLEQARKLEKQLQAAGGQGGASQGSSAKSK